MIVVAFALEFESAYFCAKYDPRLRLAVWTLGNMGSAVAAAIEHRFQASRPSLLISAGFAGSLQPEVVVGDLVVGRNYTTPTLLERLNLGAAWRMGDVLTVPAIVERGADKIRLGKETGALAADMETEHIAAVCKSHNVPLLSLRCISDGLHDDMPVPANVLMNPSTGRPEPMLLFRHLVTNPGIIGAFNQLVKNAKCAQASLAAGLEDILPQLYRII